MPDDALTTAINRVGQDVRDLRLDLTNRMDAMVTRREHDAEVKRIDAEARAARDEIARNRDALEQHEASATAQWRSVEEQIKSAEEKRESAVEAAKERRKADRRFIALWLSGAVGAAVALATFITQQMGG